MKRKCYRVSCPATNRYKTFFSRAKALETIRREWEDYRRAVLAGDRLMIADNLEEFTAFHCRELCEELPL